MTVTISPGVTTGELMEFFLNNEICFESDVILPTVTYGGVLSGGCHVSYNRWQAMHCKNTSVVLTLLWLPELQFSTYMIPRKDM